MNKYYLIICCMLLTSCFPKDQEFDIISFTAHQPKYYPASMEHESWMKERLHVKHTEISIELGQSRYGGPVVDLPKNVAYPTGLFFAGQIDLAKFSPFDKSGLLPKNGQLIFFSDSNIKKGKVIYYDQPNDSLIRHIIEHDNVFFEGTIIKNIYADKENWKERFNGFLGEWDGYAGSDRSKMFGIFTHCQWNQAKNEEITFSDKIVLLQIGENGFNDEGVFSIVIKKSDLEKRNFENCEFIGDRVKPKFACLLSSKTDKFSNH